MASPILLAVGVAVVLYRIYVYLYDRPPNYPPGPPKLPIFGTYPLLLLLNFKFVDRACATLSRWYRSPVLGMHYGSTPFITVHDMATAREVLNNPDIDGRPTFAMVRARDPHTEVWGIFFRDGGLWKSQRRYALRHLRDFGFGRRFAELESHIGEQLGAFVDMVRMGPGYEHERQLVDAGGVVQLPLAFAGHPANALLKCVLNEGLSGEEMACLYDAGRAAFRFQRNGCMFGRMFSLLEWTAWVAPAASGYRDVRSGAMGLYDVVHRIVERHYATYQPDHVRSFLDMYFGEMDREATVEGSNFHLKQITHTIVDFMLPALTAVGTSLTLLLLRLMRNPDAMQRVRHELDAVVGGGRLPTLDDRQHMPFTEAALRESLRLDTLTPNNVPHRVTADTRVAGYDLPAGSLVLVMLQEANTDEKWFRDALHFRPERFLDPDSGQLNVRLDKSLPFGAGKRLCAGETFARNMLFLFAAAVLQNFELSVPEGERMYDPVDEPATGVIRSLPDFRLKFSSR